MGKLRKQWAGGKIQRAEEMVLDFVAGPIRTAVIVRREADERQRREIEERKRAQESLGFGIQKTDRGRR